MFCVIHVTNFFVDNYYLQIIIGGVVGVAFYIGVALLFRFPEIEDVKYMLNTKK